MWIWIRVAFISCHFPSVKYWLESLRAIRSKEEPFLLLRKKWVIEILLSPNEPHTLKYLKINLRHFCVTERLEDKCRIYFLSLPECQVYWLESLLFWEPFAIAIWHFRKRNCHLKFSQTQLPFEISDLSQTQLPFDIFANAIAIWILCKRNCQLPFEICREISC